MYRLIWYLPACSRRTSVWPLHQWEHPSPPKKKTASYVSALRPLKLDDEVLVSARMRFCSRIKQVRRSSFLKKPRQNPCFLADDLASGHISWSHFGEYRLSRFQVLSAYLRMHFSTVMVSGLYEYRFPRPRFVLITCLCHSTRPSSVVLRECPEGIRAFPSEVGIARTIDLTVWRVPP
jgi:hypothetical protein